MLCNPRRFVCVCVSSFLSYSRASGDSITVLQSV